MTRNGRRFSKPTREWINYGALFVLAVVAFGVAAIALLDPRGPGETVVPATAIPQAATPKATVSVAPTPQATKGGGQPGIELPAEPVLLILGDSYTAGVGAGQPEQGWAYLVAGSLGYPTNIDGLTGTGFAWGGGAEDELAGEYVLRLQQIAADPAFVPNILILQGGQADSLIPNADEIAAATTDTIVSARRFWPGIQVVVLGPPAPQPAAAEVLATNNAVRVGAAAADAPFIDALEAGWFTTTNSLDFNFDGIHPNTAGHAHIAEKFLEVWATLAQ